MLKSLFSQKNQGRIIVLIGFIVLAAAVIAIAGQTQVVTADDGTVTIKRTLFGYTIGQ
jgi:ActR/RegA family two-component response regulator